MGATSRVTPREPLLSLALGPHPEAGRARGGGRLVTGGSMWACVCVPL